MKKNPRTAKNTDFNTFKLLFDITRKLTFDQELEIHGISATDWNTILRGRSTLLHEDAIKLSTAKSLRLFRFGALSRSSCVLPACLLRPLLLRLRLLLPRFVLVDLPALWILFYNLLCLGKTELIGSHNLFSIVSWTILKENQSCSCRKFPRTHHAEAAQEVRSMLE